MKKSICLIIALAVIIPIMTCCYASSAEPIRVGVIYPNPAGSDTRKEIYDSIQSTFTQENGYDPVLIEASTVADQQAAVESLIDQDISYMLICPAEATGWKKSKTLQKASKAGIKTFFSGKAVDCDSKMYTAAIMSVHYSEGQDAVNWLEKLKLKKYNIMLLTSSPDDETQTDHLAALKSKKWKVVYEASVSGEREDAHNIVSAYIQNNWKAQINIIIAANDEIAQGATEALDDWGIVYGYHGEPISDVYIVTFSNNKWALEKLKPEPSETFGWWNYVGICKPHHTAEITTVDSMIKTLESGNGIEGLNKNKQFFIEGKWFDAQTITTEDIESWE